jgi:hypothetical protein
MTFLKSLGILLLSIFVFKPGCLKAQQIQGNLEGTVLDRETSERLFGATLMLVENPDIGAITGGNGSYKLKLPIGLNHLRISYIGYKDTTIAVQIDQKKTLQLDILLAPDLYEMETLVVDANKIAKEIEDLALIRDAQKKQITKYAVDIHKVAVLSYINKDGTTTDIEEKEPFAFSERIVKLLFYQPDRYAEVIQGRRASKNFFSEFDFFATGGGPLDLNKNKVSLSVLSEDLTIVGPVSTSAQDYYFYDETKADSSWPDGTILYKITPKKQNAPLFFGKIWINKAEGGILGIDVGLNEFVNTSNGLYSVTDVKYSQSYTKKGEYWLPSQTKLSAKIGFLASKRAIRYTDIWEWNNYNIEEGNSQPFKIELPLYGEIVQENADKRDLDFWANQDTKIHANYKGLVQADSNQQTTKMLVNGMKALSLGYRIPTLANQSYISQVDDYYRFNRVEGHYAGLGLKSPLHHAHTYMVNGGHSFGREKWQFEVLAEQFFGYTKFGLTAGVFDRVDQRYTDRFIWVNPLYLSDLRFGTYEAGVIGLNNMDYYGNSGFNFGLKKKWNAASFVHIQYAEEKHSAINSTTARNIIGIDLRNNPRFENERAGYRTDNVDLSLMRFHFHHDTRKYQPYMLIRDFTTRSTGWVSDLVYERGVGNIDYQRYRGIINGLFPTFFSSQLELSLFFSASNAQTPQQLRYGMNGFLLDDYIMQQPFLALPFNEAIGHRSTVLFAMYRFGTAFSRAIPVDFIRKSGVRFTMFASAGFVDQNTSLEPLIPGLNYDAKLGIEQVEIGAQMTRILGVFYVRVSRRLVGDFGSEWGFQAIF